MIHYWKNTYSSFLPTRSKSPALLLRVLPFPTKIHLTSLSSKPIQSYNYSTSTTKTNNTNNNVNKLFKQKQTIPNEFLQAIHTKIPNFVINTNPYDLKSHGHGESYHPIAPPQAIVIPQLSSSSSSPVQLVRKDMKKISKDISTLIQLCNEYNIPIIPFGTGTSIEGHVCAIDPLRPTISVDLKALKFIDFHNDDGETSSDVILTDPFVTVGAGVTRLELNNALRHTGMQFMVDPGADASIGGMVACGASGTTAVKYGTMRENILSIECILPNGTIAKCGSKALKSSAGYDLTSLLTGSEGTLGIITQITVKVHPIPQHVVAAVCTFDSLHQAAEAVSMIKYSAIPVERCELLDESSVKAFNQYNDSNNNNSNHNSKKKQIDQKPTLFLEFTGPTMPVVEELVKMTEIICTQDFDGSNFQFTNEENERKALWSARHKLYYASLALRPGCKSAVITDACVPLSKFADIISETVNDVKMLDVVGPCFGHAGDGNFHCILPVLENDSEEYLSKIHQVNDNLIQRTLSVGGTCTGEHGIGYGKIKYLSQQYGEGGVEMMRTVKRAFDPLNIMNPGKVVII